MVEKNLFLHDLAVVAVIKDEAHYLKAWLDYHLAAGVDHFYLYDNGSTDETRALLEPYIKTRLVDYFSVPGAIVQMPAYNDAVHRFRFACRYMAFIDCDEFIFPKSNRSITEVVDEIFANNPKAAGLGINWQVFGSNGQETADYSKGVLERFTRRAESNWFEPMTKDTLPVGNIHVKTIANPRLIRFIVNPHYAYYFDGVFAVNSNGERVRTWGNEPVLSDKIVVNHYYTKSREEFIDKMKRGREGVDSQEFDPATVDISTFEKNDRNEVFDDGILTYRQARIENFALPKKFSRQEFFETLEKILLPATDENTPDEFFDGKLETFLTCRSLAGALRRSAPDDNRGKLMEEAALKAINRTQQKTQVSLSEILMMFSALPPILSLNYPAVEEIHKNCISFARQVMSDYRRNLHWERFVEMGNYLDLLMVLGAKKY